MVNETKKNKKKMMQINFTGKELLNEQIFDTTIENVAKENDIFDKNKKYEPMIIITGEKELHEKLENVLFEMKKGQEKVVKLSAKDAFGERRTDLVRIVPIKVFIDQKINAVPGLIINVGQMMGKIQSVSGGRVRVDFNHPLAGRDIEYEVKIEKEISDKKEVALNLFEKYFSQVPGAEKSWEKDVLYITLFESNLKGLEKVTKTISELASELGTKIEFKSKKDEKEKKPKK